MEGSAGSQSGNENGKSQAGNFRRCFSNVLNCTPLWRESKFWSQNAQDNFSVGALLEAECLKKRTPLWREASKGQHRTFGSCDVEKAHGVVERSTFRSQNAKKNTVSENFWKKSCSKSAHRCGAKHASKSKCAKHTTFGTLVELRCWKSARCCGAKHISKSKVLKTDGPGPLLDVEISEKCTQVQLQLQLQLHYTTLRYNYN